MSDFSAPTNFLEELTLLINLIKNQNPAANENFDLELFSLGYLTALQSL
jgi:hypothetical protein